MGEVIPPSLLYSTLMKIAFATLDKALDIENRSGRQYYTARSLEAQGIHVSYIDELQDLNSLFYKGKAFLNNRVLRKFLPLPRYLWRKEPTVLRGYAAQVSDRLTSSHDLMLTDTVYPLSYLTCEQPVVIWTDATFAGMVDFYPGEKDLSQSSLEKGHKAEKAALDKVHLAIFSSAWAAQTAVEHYDIDPNKVHVVPFGANLEIRPQRTLSDIENLVDQRRDKDLNLLFIGVDWVRKGGEMALDIVDHLNTLGVKAALSILGCKPKIRADQRDYVNVLGYIPKNTPRGMKEIKRLLSTSHFLLLPSRADCAPRALCEANAFGVPALTTNVGGIPSIIRDGVNGKLFSVDAKAEDYSLNILKIINNEDEYERLALESFKEYRSRLNWGVAGAQVKHLCEELLA